MYTRSFYVCIGVCTSSYDHEKYALVYVKIMVTIYCILEAQTKKLMQTLYINISIMLI